MDSQTMSDVDQVRTGVPASRIAAPTALGRSRRSLLKGAVAGAASLALVGLRARDARAEDGFLGEVFDILATGEKLNVVFYSQGVANGGTLGFSDDELTSLQAILVEEQLHNNYAELNGGVAVTTHFSFPMGAMTFTDRASFLSTMQGIEEVTNGALLALIKDFADHGLSQHAQFAGQLMQVEGGHRAVNRALRGAYPLEDWAFGPVTIQHFADVPGVVAKAGFLSPTAGNDYAYQPVSTQLSSISNVAP